MKTTELRDKSADELVALEKELRQGLFDQRLKNFTNRLDDTSLVRKARRDIARVRTLLAEKSRQKA
ncbi:MAG: 50S ribosomal protein L29 [Polyangiaceae bacterium]|jgi:large subunit ribosomal protein L29|nr:50S ribosomal protein L29 [Polyangiaceae bacterium]